MNCCHDIVSWIIHNTTHAIHHKQVVSNWLYLAEGPAQFNLVHPPQLVNVFGQFVPDIVEMRWEDNLRGATMQLNADEQANKFELMYIHVNLRVMAQ